MENSILVWTIFTLVFHQMNCISISSNGNSPQRKMLSIDAKDIEFGGFVPINPMRYQTQSLNYNPPPAKAYLNSSTLPVNERYRRLIPYMTFYLANNFNDPQTDDYAAKSQLQKIAIPNNNAVQRTQNGKILTQYSNVPHFQGNRLSQFNIASAYPNKIVQDYYYPNMPQNVIQYQTSNQNPLVQENKFSPIQSIMKAPPKHQNQNVYDLYRPIPVPVKVSANVYNLGESPNHYYQSNPVENNQQQQYRLVPYEQTPPVQVPEYNEDYFVPKVNPYRTPIPVPVSNNPRPSSEQKFAHYSKDVELINYGQNYNDNIYKEQYSPHVENLISPNPHESNDEIDYQSIKKYNLKNTADNHIYPTTESGFKPIINSRLITPTPSPKFTYITSAPYISVGNINKQYTTTQKPEQSEYNIQTTIKPDYSDHSHINYGPSSGDQFEQNNLATILKSLQSSNSIPEMITTDNIDSSIKTLVKILKDLKGNQKYVETSSLRPMISTPIPFQATPKPKPITNAHSNMVESRHRQQHKSLKLAKVAVKPLQPVHEYPPQDLEIEHVVEPPSNGIGGSQTFPLEYYEHGGTPGRIGIDYPALSVIPNTSFDCKTQRYKGFFGDPETKCQVWHYCDLNGGQASFLCPNGTIFSQVALTCDWWFNVKCSTTTQLYVLNERLYKYILPFSPKFPEDYSGPLVDKYLTIKYKEMEEKMKKKKKVLKPDTSLETEKADVIEIKTSGMSGALRPYEN